MKTPALLLILALFPAQLLSASPETDRPFSEMLSKVLLEEYDARNAGLSLESVILKAGRRSYRELLEFWCAWTPDIDSAPVRPDPMLNRIADIIGESVGRDEAEEYRSLCVRLTRLTLRNIQFIFEAVQSRGSVPDGNITVPYVDACTLNLGYFRNQTALIAEERNTRNRMFELMSDSRVSLRLLFQRQIFSLLSSVRERAIDRFNARFMNAFPELRP